MLMAIDVGNTNIVLGVYDGERLLHHWRVATDPARTSDEYGILVLSLCEHSGFAKREIDAILIASVVPPMVPLLTEVGREYFGIEPTFVGPGIRTGMPILYDSPREVGADRIVNAVGAFDRYARACIVVDFGTATTFDVVSERGEYLGGVIAPGLAISMEALFRHASKLPRVELTRPRSVIGKNTVHSMQSGLVYGYAGLVDALVARLAEEMGGSHKPYVVATGGLAPLIAAETASIDEVNEWLTLDGLRVIHGRNRG